MGEFAKPGVMASLLSPPPGPRLGEFAPAVRFPRIAHEVLDVAELRGRCLMVTSTDSIAFAKDWAIARGKIWKGLRPDCIPAAQAR